MIAPSHPPFIPTGVIISCTTLFTVGFHESTARLDIDDGKVDLDEELEKLRREAAADSSLSSGTAFDFRPSVVESLDGDTVKLLA